MADKPAGERTEKPSPRRIRKSREKGQVAQSQELPAVLSLVTLLIVCIAIGPKLFAWLKIKVIESLSGRHEIFSSTASYNEFFSREVSETAIVMAPFLVALMLAGAAGSLFVGGMTWSLHPIKWKLGAISPIKGTKKLFSIQALVKLLLSVAKLALIGAIAYFYLSGKLDTFVRMQWLWSAEMMKGLCSPIVGVTIRICIALLVIALIDVAFQKWKHMKDMKMTKQEVKEEHKDTDGSPELKSKIRQNMMSASAKRMLEEVPKADVVLVNPTHVAVAIKYDASVSDAPIVIAKGGDNICEKIKDTARAWGVPIVRKPPLARAVFNTVKIDEPIPEHLFVAVAEVLAMIYRIRRRKQLANG